MPRYLYLLRHAESNSKQLNEIDKERSLSSRGIKEALMMGAYLLKKKTVLNIIMSSTALRALTTANLITESLKIDSEKISPQDDLYEASPRTFHQFISQLDDDHQQVMCVAHNPTISYVAEFFTASEIGDMAPGGLCIIKFDIDSWKEVGQGNGELERYLFPDMLVD
ncbi:MAG TPA: histidine phosphatase family protein [Chryseolinea sp.]|nr:histidine phosphatase family protein [Chryseolinea sp.]HPM30841.1 histidine phosphatase family protein [Chryseolinea sp.]